MKPGARRVALIVVATALAIIVGAGGWYLLGEEHRTGRIVAGVLSSRLGVPITVERAAARGTDLSLRGVRVQAPGGSAVDITIDRLDIEGGVLPLVVPSGRRRLTIVAASTSVTLRDGGESPSPTVAIETLRNAAAALLAWPGALSLRVDAGQLARAGHTFPLELTAEKTSDGLTVALTLRDAATQVLRLTARSTGSTDSAVTTHVDFVVLPSKLTGLWPASLPTTAMLAGNSDVSLARDGNMTMNARLHAGDVAGAPVIELTSRWDSAKAELVVSRYTLDWGRDLRLAGAATLPADGRPLSASAQGTMDGSAVRGRAAYGLADGAFNGEVTLEPFSAMRLAQRFGTAVSTEIAARTLISRFTGAGRGRPRVSFDFTGQGVTTPALTLIPLDVAGVATIELAGSRAAAVALNAATLALSRNGRTIGQVAAASRRGGPWPIEVRGTVDDAAALAPLLPMPVRLTGRATFDGEIASASPPVFRGTVHAQLSEADLTAAGHVTFTGITATVPIGFGVEAAAAGTVTSERVTAYGFTATGVTSTARLNAGRLLLPDIRYSHYGGEGGGWLEAAVDGRPTPVRARLQGTRVDLAALVRDIGTSAGQITGHLHYELTAQYTADKGLAAVMELASDGGGEVSIEPIQRLLDSATVQAETTGVLQQTLQNLRVFNYESLEGTLTWSQGAGHIDLSLKGKKRLGIFPGPVDAINFRNVPLTVLARTLTRGTPP